MSSEETAAQPKKKPKIFISHSKKDEAYAKYLVNLLGEMGIAKTRGNIFCSSIPQLQIPTGENIYDYLRAQFEEYELIVIMLLSQNYYDSVACLNEMGAAWVLKSSCRAILLPGFEYQEIKGAVDPRVAEVKLDADTSETRQRMNDLRAIITMHFSEDIYRNDMWERGLDGFITSCKRLGCRRFNSQMKAVSDAELIEKITNKINSLSVAETCHLFCFFSHSTSYIPRAVRDESPAIGIMRASMEVLSERGLVRAGGGNEHVAGQPYTMPTEVANAIRDAGLWEKVAAELFPHQEPTGNRNTSNRAQNEAVIQYILGHDGAIFATHNEDQYVLHLYRDCPVAVFTYDKYEFDEKVDITKITPAPARLSKLYLIRHLQARGLWEPVRNIMSSADMMDLWESASFIDCAAPDFQTFVAGFTVIMEEMGMNMNDIIDNCRYFSARG